jgi:hypothetical protein
MLKIVVMTIQQSIFGYRDFEFSRWWLSSLMSLTFCPLFQYRCIFISCTLRIEAAHNSKKDIGKMLSHPIRQYSSDFWVICRRVRPITMATRSMAWTVFARSNTGVVGSNHNQGMNVCVRLFCICVVLCVGSGLATIWCPVQGFILTVYIIENLKSGRSQQGYRAIEKKMGAYGTELVI